MVKGLEEAVAEARGRIDGKPISGCPTLSLIDFSRHSSANDVLVDAILHDCMIFRFNHGLIGRTGAEEARNMWMDRFNSERSSGRNSSASTRWTTSTYPCTTLRTSGSSPSTLSFSVHWFAHNKEVRQSAHSEAKQYRGLYVKQIAAFGRAAGPGYCDCGRRRAACPNRGARSVKRTHCDHFVCTHPTEHGDRYVRLGRAGKAVAGTPELPNPHGRTLNRLAVLLAKPLIEHLKRQRKKDRAVRSVLVAFAGIMILNRPLLIEGWLAAAATAKCCSELRAFTHLPPDCFCARPAY